MRKIDGDELIKTLKSVKYFSVDSISRIQNAEIERCISFVETAPEILDKGEWIPYTDPDELAAGHDLYAEGLKCSECNYKKMKFSGPSNYCPNCGARMKE